MRSKMIVSVVLSGLICGSALAREPVPAIAETRLYTDLARGCYDVDLDTWRHPVRDVLKKYQVGVTQVRLCSRDKYPVFYVDLKYDPQGQTADFYRPFYRDMKKANGGWPYSLVSDRDQMIINVSFGKRGETRTEFEYYKL